MTEPPARRRPGHVSDAVPDELPIGEVARRLGVTTDAVRKRLRRGTLAGRKTAAGWVVTGTASLFPADAGQDASRTGADAALAELRGRLADAQSENAYLRQQLDHQTQITGMMARRLAELPATLPSPDIPQERNPGSSRNAVAETAPETYEPATVAMASGWRRWWRKLTGG